MQLEGPNTFSLVMEEAALEGAERRLAAARESLSRTPSDKVLRKAFQTALAECVQAAHARNVLWAEFREVVRKEALEIHRKTSAEGRTR